ncbi:sugar ABC transporter permease [Tessaracoccus coleopterorum]|uniref:sugar ABC transporter permease n=1 Tax=Tessaracoccus coleopterorum TaxID=2714950 RepID=UPI0018D456CF|nr:sugar ABC transporter permease [Tessaracoccus coleopterorum]
MTTTTARSTRGNLARIEARQALGFASPALVGLALFTIVPVVLSVVMSFFDWPTFGERTFNGEPTISSC